MRRTFAAAMLAAAVSLTCTFVAAPLQSAGAQHAALPSAPPTVPADAQRIAAATALVAAMGAEDQGRVTIQQLKDALIAHMQATEPAKVVGFTAYAERELAPNSPRVQAYLADVSRLAIDFYSSFFSVEEMNAVTAFQRSEPGRKFQALTPQLGGAVASRTMQFQSELIQAINQGAARSGTP